MGRASRKGAASAAPREHWSETHPDRHLWTEAQLVHARMQTQEEYEALYGRGAAVPRRSHQSSFLFSGDIPDPMSTAQRIEIIAQIEAPEEAIADKFLRDPSIDQLWQAELGRIQREADLYENSLDSADLRHWIRDWEDDPRRMRSLENTWKGSLLPGHLLPEEEEVSVARPSSVLAAARECPDHVWKEPDFVRQLAVLQRKGGPEYEQLIADTVLPEFEYIARPVQVLEDSYPYLATPALAQELWRVAQFLADDKGDKVDGDFSQEYIRQALWRGSVEEDLSEPFASSPIAASDSVWRTEGSSRDPDFNIYPSLYQEAAARVNVEDLESDPQREIARIKRHLLAAQLMRIGYGLDRDLQEDIDVDKEMKDRWQSWQDDSPLENFRPLFRGEEQEHLLEDLLRRYSDCHEKGVYALLERELVLHVKAPSPGNTLSEQIHKALLRVEDHIKSSAP